MKLPICLIVICLVFSSVRARDLTLQQAVELSRQHSLALKAAEADRRAADLGVKVAQAGRLPSLKWTTDISLLDDVPTLDITIPPAFAISRPVGSKENYQTDLRLTFPLHTGGRLSGAIATARAQSQYFAALHLRQEDQLLLRTRTSYLELLKSDKLVAAAEASLQRTRIIADNVQSMLQAGAADSVAVLESRLAVNRATFDFQRAVSGRRAAEISLLVLLVLNPSETINPVTKFEPPKPPRQLSDLSMNKPELLAASARVKIRQASLRLSKADFLPTLSLVAGYSYGKPNLDRFNDTWNDYFVVGAHVDWSLNVFRSRSRTLEKRQQLESSRRQAERLHDQLDRSARLTYEALKLAWARYQNIREEQRLTADNFRLARHQYEAGTLESNRLLEIEATLSAAEASLAAARVDYYIAEANYQFAVGSPSQKKGS